MVGFPNKPMGFRTKMIILGCFGWYHHLRKYPYVLRKGDPQTSPLLGMGIEIINPTEGSGFLGYCMSFSLANLMILCQQNKLTPLYNMLMDMLFTRPIP